MLSTDLLHVDYPWESLAAQVAVCRGCPMNDLHKPTPRSAEPNPISRTSQIRDYTPLGFCGFLLYSIIETTDDRYRCKIIGRFEAERSIILSMFSKASSGYGINNTSQYDKDRIRESKSIQISVAIFGWAQYTLTCSQHFHNNSFIRGGRGPCKYHDRILNT